MVLMVMIEEFVVIDDVLVIVGGVDEGDWRMCGGW